MSKGEQNKHCSIGPGETEIRKRQAADKLFENKFDFLK
jgi:hypothetical protein